MKVCPSISIYRKVTALTITLYIYISAGFHNRANANDHPLIDPALPAYTQVSGVSGNLLSAGSDTLMDLMTLWRIKFQKYYPDARVDTQSPGDEAGIAALINGTVQMVPMARRMTPEEHADFQTTHDYKLTAIPVAMDMLAVFVHLENPLEKLSIQQLDAVFSSTRLCGSRKAIGEWGQLDLQDSWQAQPIEAYSRDTQSGLYQHFSQQGLCNGTLKSSVKTIGNTGALIQTVADSMAAMGYSGITALTHRVKTVAIQTHGQKAPVAPTPDNALNGRYPLTRFLYVYVNKHPHRLLPPLEREFLKLVLSREGQTLVAQYGYIPLSAQAVRTARRSLSIGK